MQLENAPTKVLLMDAYCVSHVGNDVLLESSIQVVRKIFDNPEILVHAKTPDAFRESMGVMCGRRLFPDPPRSKAGKIGWLLGEVMFMLIQGINMATLSVPPHYLAFGARRAALRDYERCDVAVSIGGEMLNDSFRKTLPMYLFMFWLSKKCGNKTIVFPQSIGPLRRRWTRWLTRAVLQDLDIVSPRDEPSRQELIGLGLSGDRILPSPDVGLAQPWVSAGEARRYLSDLDIELDSSKTWVGLTTSAWVEEGVSRRNYLDEIVDGIREFCRTHDTGVLIMPANMPVKGNSSSDYDASSALHKRIGEFCESMILPPTAVPARMFKGIAALTDIFISTRMHAAIMSSMAATPTITINTQRKLFGYMDLIGQARFALEIEGLNGQKISDTMEIIVNEHQRICAELLAAREAQTEMLDAYARRVRDILSSGER